jgi:hypothetical protein
MDTLANLDLQQFTLSQLLGIVAGYLKSLGDTTPDDTEAGALWAVLQEIEKRRRSEGMRGTP